MEMLEQSKKMGYEGGKSKAMQMGPRDINTPVGPNQNPIG